MKLITWNVNGLVCPPRAHPCSQDCWHYLTPPVVAALRLIVPRLSGRLPKVLEASTCCAVAHPGTLQAPTLKNIELQHGTLRAFFDSLGADIVCLQETKLEDTTVTPAMRNVAGFESFWTCSKDKRGYSGCATFVRLDFAACAAQDDTSLHGALSPSDGFQHSQPSPRQQQLCKHCVQASPICSAKAASCSQTTATLC